MCDRFVVVVVVACLLPRHTGIFGGIISVSGVWMLLCKQLRAPDS